MGWPFLFIITISAMISGSTNNSPTQQPIVLTKISLEKKTSGIFFSHRHFYSSRHKTIKYVFVFFIFQFSSFLHSNKMLLFNKSIDFISILIFKQQPSNLLVSNDPEVWPEQPLVVFKMWSFHRRKMMFNFFFLFFIGNNYSEHMLCST